MRASSLESVINNYAVFQALWEDAKDIVKDSETRARIIGVQATMTTFAYFFGLVLGERILKHTDNLSKTLQKPSLTAFEGQEIAELTCQTLQKIRTDESFDQFWQNIMLLKEQKGVSEPVLPRKRKAPARFEVGSSSGHHPETPKEMFRQHYFECLDLIVNCIKDRFDQPGYRVLKNLEDLLLKAARNEDYTKELDFVLNLYKDDFVPSRLRAQLELLSTYFNSDEQKPTLLDIREHFALASPAMRSLMSEICTLLKLILVIPATNAVSERSASALRRLKTYLRSTMSQLRLNNLMVLHVHQQNTDTLDLAACLNDFVLGSEHRLSLFGKF